MTSLQSANSWMHEAFQAYTDAESLRAKAEDTPSFIAQCILIDASNSAYRLAEGCNDEAQFFFGQAERYPNQ